MEMDFSEENLTALISYSDQEVTSFKQEVASFYSYLFNENNICVSCPSKLKYYHKKLKESGLQILKNRKMNKNTASFRLRPEIGSLQMDFGSAEYFNNDTLTDEIAIKYLQINENRIANFDVYPENWKELIQTEPTEKRRGIKQNVNR